MFSYDKAFSRNIGWYTPEDQDRIKHAKIAIAGMGGVGGEHLVTLARLGVSNFNISDFDKFDIHNMNRQAGCFMSTLGQDKTAVMERTAVDINPECLVTNFPEGINSENVDQFLEDVDVYVDSLDFFAIEARELIFAKCQQKSIPVVTAAPLGMGAAFLCFMPGKMGYEEYFRFADVHSRREKLIKFLVGLSPSMLQKDYLVVIESADFNKEQGPSTAIAIKLCAGIAASNVIKIILKRGEVPVAPYGLHFDGYKNKLKKTHRPRGNRSLIQRVMYKIAMHIVTPDVR